MSRYGRFLWLCLAFLGSLGASRAEAAPVRLSEVLYDALGSDDGNVFVELFGPAGLSLDGFVVEGVNGAGGAIGPVLGLSGTVPEGGFFVVADLAGKTTAVLGADLLLDFDFQNGPDSVVLRAPSGEVIDALAYGVFGPTDVLAGEGTPAPDPAAGRSLARRFANLDTDDNARDFEILASPTPGFGPTQVPEPTRGALLMAALAAWLCARRTTRAVPQLASRWL